MALATKYYVYSETSHNRLLDNLCTMDSCHGTDCFCYTYGVFLTSEIRTTSIFWTTENADGPERQQLYKITSESGQRLKLWSKFRCIVTQRHLERPLIYSFLSILFSLGSVQSVSCIITLQATPLPQKILEFLNCFEAL